MLAHVQVDPAAVRATAAEVDALLPALRIGELDPGDLAVLARAPGGAALVAEHDRLTSAVAAAGRELAALVADLRAAAEVVAGAECGVVTALQAVYR